MAGRLKAQFTIEDVVPNWPGSFGWDRKDVGHVGQAGVVVCANETCRLRFPLPVTLFNLIAGG